MKNLICFLFLLTFILVGHKIEGQCEGSYSVTLNETFEIQGDSVIGEFTLTFVDLLEAQVNFDIIPDPNLPPYTGPKSTSPFTVEYKVPYSYDCAEGSFPFEGLNIEVVTGQNGIGCDTTFIRTLNSMSQTQCEVNTGGNSTGDDRQVGNTIERLGDGRLTTLNADGTVVAFSSSNGYYICELLENTWTPIGQEIITEAPVEEFFLSENGATIFVNFALGFTPQCTYRNDDAWETNFIRTTTSGESVTQILDVTADASYILYQIIESEELGSRSFSACGSFSNPGVIESVVNINSVTGISGGSIVEGFLSDNGTYYCVVDGENNRTAFYNVSGEEISTFSGQVIFASGDLSTCLIDSDPNTDFGIISVWDGTSTFYTSEEIVVEGISSYSFSSDGSICAGTTEEGELTYVKNEVVDGVVELTVNQFVVEGIMPFQTGGISGNGKRLTFTDFDNRVFVFEMDNANENCYDIGIGSGGPSCDDPTSYFDIEIEPQLPEEFSTTLVGPSGEVDAELIVELIQQADSSIRAFYFLTEVLEPGNYTLTITTSDPECASSQSFVVSERVDGNGNPCAIEIGDCDNDGILDDIDIDNDNDGIIDAIECPSATDYSETAFGGSSFEIKTDHGDRIQVTSGEMESSDQASNTRLPNDFQLSEGTGLINRIEFNFPHDIINVSVTTNDYDVDQFLDPIEYMSNFSTPPSRIVGEGFILDGMVGPLINNSTFTMIWDNIEPGTRSLSWDSHRVTGDLGVRLQVDQVCFDIDRDGIPNHKDPDSDGDGCVDAEEAGHTDPDGDGILGNSPVVVNDLGQVIDQGGYNGITIAVLTSEEILCEEEECVELNISAGTDELTTCPDEAITFTTEDLLANDNASNDQNLQIQEVSLNNPEHGSLTNNEDGSWTFVPAPDFTGVADLSYIVKTDDGSLFFADNGHFYEFVEAQGIEWADAMAAADAKKLNGLQGYLATITSQEENDFITSKLNGNGWMGASDQEVEGDWRWVTGPENGQQFWQGDSSGSPVDGAYQNWQGSAEGAQIQPDNNNAGVEENFGHLLPDGQWNDWPIIELAPFTDPNGYVVEYGGLEDCAFQFIAMGTITITIGNSSCPIEECDICPGDLTPPVITCPEDVTISASEFENSGNTRESIFGGFESEYTQADLSLGTSALISEGVYAVTNDASLYHPEFANCDDADGNPDGEMLVFNGASDTGVAVYCQSVEVVEGTTYDMSVMVASLISVRPAVIQFSVDAQAEGTTHTASSDLCVWTELATTWTAPVSGPVRICVLNQNDATGGNDFALDNFSITAEDGTELEVGTSLGTATATDECAEVIPTFVDSEEVNDCGRIITRTWTAIDPCGNESTCAQIITVINDGGDLEAVPGCTDPNSENYNPNATCNDGSCIPNDCTNTVEIFFIEEATCDNPNTILGFSTSPPILVGTEISGEGPSEVNILTTDDGVTITTSGVNQELAPGTYVFTFITEDGCIKTTSYEVPALIEGCTNPNAPNYNPNAICDDGSCSTVEECDSCTDTTPPVIEGVEVFIVGECGELSLEELGVTATDNCGQEVTITFEDFNFSPSCLGSLQRTYTATDNCGNTSQVVQIIELTNNNGPLVVCPEDASYECIEDVPEPVDPEISHGCGLEVTVTFDESRTEEGCTTIITRVWTAVDACGGVTVCTQTITVNDSQAPVVPETPASIEIQCADDVPAPAELSAEDNCGGTILGVPVDVVTPGDCPNSFVVTRTWTFTDECANSSTVTQTITVNDTEAPVAPETPAPIAVQCADDVPAAENLIAEDNCSGAISGEPTDVVTPGDCPNSFVVTRTWTFTDECGNSSTVSQTITVNDTEAPVAPEAPAPIAVQCADDVPAAIELTAEDNCSGEISGVPIDVVTPGDCPNSFVVTRTWMFTDECGNSSTVTQTITVNDTEGPIAQEPPAPITVQCADNVPAAVNLIAQDNCSGVVDGVPSDVVTPGDCPNSFVVTRTWTFTDECGNSSSVSQTITVDDTQAPVPPTIPEVLTFQCEGDVPAPEELIAEDNCSGTIIGALTVTSTAGPCRNSFQQRRTWTFTDECGNSSEVTQSIIVEDTEAPVVPETPEPLVIQCADDVPAAAELAAEDNCSGSILGVPTDVVTPGECPNSFVVTRTWTFTDECGNSSNVSQLITVNDTEAPVTPEAPAPIAVQCADDVPAAATLTAEDNCSGSITGVPADVVTPGDCPNSFLVTRTWVFTDECGNSSSVSQLLTVEDTEAPTFVNVPENVVVECIEDVGELQELSATDNCQEPNVSCERSEDIDECGNGIITITCTAVDECGNASTASYSITINDTTAPVLEGVPGDITIECNEAIPEAPEVIAFDNCDEEVQVTYTEVINGGETLECALQQPAEPVCHETENWAMVLFDLPLGKFFSNVEANFAEFPDGTAQLSGNVSDNTNPEDGGFIIDVSFENKMTWAQWSNQDFPTSFKDECATGNHETWSYYIISEGGTLTGYGRYEGTVLELEHAPSNKFFAYQVGQGANNVNSSFGNGGWFIANGDVIVDGETFSNVRTAGDFAFDGDCCTTYEIERTWSATDCSGNESALGTQIITISADESGLVEEENPLESQVLAQSKGKNIAITKVVPNPTSDFATVSYVLKNATSVVIDVVDTNGNVLQKMFLENIKTDVEHNFRIEAEDMESGVYLVRINSGQELALTKIVVVN